MNCGQWSDIVAVRLRLKLAVQIASAEITFEEILSIIVLEWFAILVGWNIYGIKGNLEIH